LKRKIVYGLMLVIIGFTLTFNVPSPLSAFSKDPINQRPLSALDKLEADYQAGKISLNKYLLYKVWRVSNSDRLPREYRLSSEEISLQSKTATMTILEIRENWHLLTSETQNQLGFVLQRPTDPNGGIDDKQHLLPKLYNTTNFVLHWTNGTDGGRATDAVPLDDTDMSGFPDYVENFAVIFENVWTFEVTTRGFPAPPSDLAEPDDINRKNPDGRYDVFIFNMRYYGYTDPEQWTSSSYSYIAVENDYAGFRTQGLEAMQVTAAHEFFHAIQFGIDLYEERWWMEATATHMEDEVYPEVNDNYQYLPGWFQFPDNGLESTIGFYEYGNFIFAKRLSEDFGDDIIREIWEEMVNSSGLTAINNILVHKNSSLVSEFSRFVTSNFFLEDMYVDGADYRQAITKWTTFKGVWLEYQYDAFLNLTIDSTNVNRDAWMDKWATDYITLKLDSSKPDYTYVVLFDGLDLTTNYLVKLATKKAGNISERIFQLDAQKNGNLSLVYDTFENITLIIANAGNTTSANPSWKVIINVLPPKPPPPPPVYDVAIIGVEPSTTIAFPEQTINILVTVLNNGTVRNETFNVSAYWGQLQIGTRLVIDLPPNTKENLTIFWTIPPGLLGEAKIWSNTTIREEETNIANNRLENGNLAIAAGIHDGAIINVVSKTIVGKGYSVPIDVIVQNQGNYTETFTVTCYVNASEIETKEMTLNSGERRVVTFSWNTTGYQEYRNYTISVYLHPVLNETDLADNTGLGGTVLVTMVGDVNGDRMVDIRDIASIAIRYGSKKGGPRYAANYDLDGDGAIDIRDIAAAARRFGKRYS